MGGKTITDSVLSGMIIDSALLGTVLGSALSGLRCLASLAQEHQQAETVACDDHRCSFYWLMKRALKGGTKAWDSRDAGGQIQSFVLTNTGNSKAVAVWPVMLAAGHTLLNHLHSIMVTGILVWLPSF
jgi:hypothetical protein